MSGRAPRSSKSLSSTKRLQPPSRLIRAIPFLLSLPSSPLIPSYYYDVASFSELPFLPLPSLFTSSKSYPTPPPTNLFRLFFSAFLFAIVPSYAAMDLDSAGFEAIKIEDRGFAKDICAAQPWQTVVPFLEPAGLPEEGVSDAAPDTHLNLEWAYGFNAKASRQTVRDRFRAKERVCSCACVWRVLDQPRKGSTNSRGK